MIKEIYLPYFENKKVTVLGLGLLGRGLGDTEFLIQNGADVICTDTRSKEKLAESISFITKNNPNNLKLIIGENRLEDFENRDYVLTCTGMPVDYEYLMHAKKNNIPVYMSAALVCDIVMKELPNVIIIGVTGTRGKTTVTEMIAHILRENAVSREAQSDSDGRSGSDYVHLGGNIRGIANLPLLEKIEDGDFLVLELDSWQLQGFGDMKISPHIAVFTSFLDDHMNYYKNNKDLYFNDKANIYRNQHEGDVLIVSAQVSSEIIIRRERVSMTIPDYKSFDMKLIGEHNQVAASLAYEVGLQCGLDDESIRNAIKTFKAVDGRLEDMGLFKNNIRVYNDNNATTGDATIRALESISAAYFSHKHDCSKPHTHLHPGIILITGGTDKGLPIDELEKNIKTKTKEVIYLSGTGTDRISLPKKYEFEKLADCIKKAFELASDGDVILFSPAFASFSKYFNNEYERNDVFVKEVQKYA